MANTPVPNPTWLGLLTRLGIQRVGTFFLGEVVVPVALVDAGSVTLTSISRTPLFGTPSSAGEVASPAANTRLADTGALAAGNWSFMVWLASGEANSFRLRRRNAADAADIWSFRSGKVADASIFFPVFRSPMAASERLVVENVGAGGAVQYQASIFAVQDA